MQNERNPAARFFRRAVRLAAAPFAWPAAALRRTRASLAERAHSAEHAGFNVRAWSPELLKHLEWRRFEELCAAWLEARAELSGNPPLLMHCKPWDAYRVGIKPVRALHAAMAAAGASEALFVTSGRFTPEAVAFAAKENIGLVDGAALLADLAALPPEKSLALLKLATQGDFLTPTCPACSIKMTSRRSTQSGRAYWGCFNYPRCKLTFSGTVPA